MSREKKRNEKTTKFAKKYLKLIIFDWQIMFKKKKKKIFFIIFIFPLL